MPSCNEAVNGCAAAPDTSSRLKSPGVASVRDTAGV